MNSYSKQMYYPSVSTTTKMLVASTAMFLALQGTGSNYDMENVGKWVQHVERRTLLAIDAKQLVNFTPYAMRTIVEHMENIRSIHNIPFSEWASFFGVSRQAIYKWLGGKAEPEKEKQDRIVKLSGIIDRLREADSVQVGALLKMKAFNGLSLIDLLSTHQYTEEHLNVILNEARIAKAAYQQSGLLSSKAKSTNDWQSSISIPGTIDKH